MTRRSNGVLWLALATRRGDDVTLYVARVAAGERGIRHPLAIGSAGAGSTYAREGFRRRMAFALAPDSPMLLHPASEVVACRSVRGLVTAFFSV